MYSIYALVIFPGNAINIISAIGLVIGVKKDIFILVAQYLILGAFALAYKIHLITSISDTIILVAFAIIDVVFYIIVCCYFYEMKKKEKEKQLNSESNAVPDISVQ
ncbi:hypothetical protein PIROE2DRAFT_3839 [Piromyces sp. E2]|nr:hypothetical protein PIROE2DRAFT_3839 [Piromyces sp. E2]|eukprot:OUM68397.1 hypothetical protein PIROE2DRAFT_3839 [Piromyces sp. E2]